MYINMFHQIWGVFGHYFAKYFFLPLSPSRFLLGLILCPCWHALWCLTGFVALSNFLYSFFFVFLIPDYLHCPIFEFIEPFFCLLKYAIGILYWIFIFIIVLFNFRMSLWFLFIISTYLLIFCIWRDIVLILFCSSLGIVSFMSLKIFLKADLKF